MKKLNRIPKFITKATIPFNTIQGELNVSTMHKSASDDEMLTRSFPVSDPERREAEKRKSKSQSDLAYAAANAVTSSH